MRRPTMTLSIVGPRERPYVYGDGVALERPIPGDRCDPEWIHPHLGGTIPAFVTERLGWFGCEGYIKPGNPNEVWVRRKA